MAIAIYFTPASMSAGQYGECIRQLEDAGKAAPEGRLYHACFGEGDRLQVFDVWESAEAFERFGQTLVPILQGLGLEADPPTMSPVHRILEG